MLTFQNPLLHGISNDLPLGRYECLLEPHFSKFKDLAMGKHYYYCYESNSFFGPFSIPTIDECQNIQIYTAIKFYSTVL